MQLIHRKDGAEQPFWAFGPFKIRLPFVHYRWETAEMLQALIMFVVSLGMIPLLMKFLGLPYDVALAYVVVCGIGFMLPALLGVVLGGWARQRLSEQAFRRGLQLALIALGAYMLPHAFTA